MNIWFRPTGYLVLVGLALGLMQFPLSAQETLVEYGVDVVSDYVFRGSDLHREVYVVRKEDETAFNISPAAQPTVTIYGPAGLWFNFWGSFALMERDEDTATGFSGLETVDEVDTTIAFDWENRLGSFSAGIVNYALVNSKAQGHNATVQEMYFSWGLPILESVSPSIAHYSDSNSGAYYSALGAEGGETLSWSGNLGFVSGGIQDITLGLGYELTDSLSISANVALRPQPEFHGYTSDGKYISAKDASEKDYAPAIFWVGLSYSGDPITE